MTDSVIHHVYPHYHNGSQNNTNQHNDKNDFSMNSSNRHQWHYGDDLSNGYSHANNNNYDDNGNVNYRGRNDNSTATLLNRFQSLATGSYKYNPFIINQINRLGNNEEYVTDQDFYRLFRKQSFNNEYLNSLQRDSNYFRFEYFNPLNAKNYYKNLDEQVLALITGEIGSMPDLKKPSDKKSDEEADIHSHDQDKIIDSNEDDKESANNNNDKYKNINIALITSIIIIFAGVTGAYLYKRFKKST